MNSLEETKFLQDLVDYDKGFLVMKEFLTCHQVNAYRAECQSVFRTAPRVEKWPGYGEGRVNRTDMYDYVNPKLDKNGQVVYWRLFQFLHNPHSAETEKIFQKALSFRNHIESHWLYDLNYHKTKESLGDYVQAIQHVEEGRGLAKHTDFKGQTTFPLLQCVILLSDPDRDYVGGELFLYTKSGRCVGVHTDLHMRKGDALFFDKSLFHEVEPTYHAGPTGAGRWSVIIGARYRMPITQQSLLRRKLNSPWEYLKSFWRDKVETLNRF